MMEYRHYPQIALLNQNITTANGKNFMRELSRYKEAQLSEGKLLNSEL